MRTTQVLIALLALGATAACRKEKDSNSGMLLANVSGTVQLPVSASRLMLYKKGNSGYSVSVAWETCAPQGQENKSKVIDGGAVLAESTNNCSGAQYVTVKATNSIDVSAFASGTLHFTVEVSNAGQGLQFLVQ